MVLRVFKRPQMEQAIGYPQCLIRVTGLVASSLRQLLSDPLPLSKLIILDKHDDIRAWHLATTGKNPLNLLIQEPRSGQDGNRDATPVHASP